MRKIGTFKCRLAAVCICAAMICMTLFVSDMEVKAQSPKNEFKVNIEANGKVRTGKKATFKITVVNTTNKSQKLSRFRTIYSFYESIGKGDLDGKVFGEVRDSKGKKLARSKKGGKLKKTIRFAAKEKRVFTLSCTIPESWEGWGGALIAVAVNDCYDYAGSDQAAVYRAYEDIKISSVTPARKKATVNWDNGGLDGYQVQYSLNKNFKKAKIKSVSKKKKSLTINNLKSKKTYYVRIREYEKTSFGTTYYSWSPAKKVKIK